MKTSQTHQIDAGLKTNIDSLFSLIIVPFITNYYSS